MIGLSGYVGCCPAMHHALMRQESRNVPLGTARDCGVQSCLGSMIMEAGSRQTYRRQKLIKCEIGSRERSVLLLSLPGATPACATRCHRAFLPEWL